MVEIEHIQDIEKDQPAKSSAKEQKLKDPKDLTTETQDTGCLNSGMLNLK